MTERPLLYLEPIGGIAGDMFMAAAIDLGVAPAELERALSGLNVPGWRLEVTRSQRHHISGTHVDVTVAAESVQPERALTEIQALIRGATTMSELARERALRVFQVIGEAEARVHGVPIEQIHFHEVGAVDSIVDVCGAAVALDLLGDPELLSAPPPLGSGFVRAAHGNMPVPVPATLEILRDLPVRFEGVGELTTPTGAAILKALARIETPRAWVTRKIGYGVGTRDFQDRPNVLRASLGSRVSERGDPKPSSTWVIEANLDDCSPQVLGAVLERVIELGAHDAYVVPATMKKSRPGHLLTVVVPADLQDAVTACLLRETTTLGVRAHAVDRTVLERHHQTVQTPWGEVRIKVGTRGGEVLNAHPEFEDCLQRSRASNVSLKQVMAEALAAYYR